MAAKRNYTFGSQTYDLDSRTFVMGILNVTPDSFSDGGTYLDSTVAVEHGLHMVEEGADFIDVGGESTRPGSEPIPIEEELNRVIPVISRLSQLTNIPISIDTYKSEVARQALDAGAVIVNDITGLHGDAKMPLIISRRKASVILMHIYGNPKIMQENPRYDNLIEEISSYLQDSIDMAERNGIHQLILDPGIGFGKTLQHNLQIINQLKSFQRFGYPVLVGPSRKSFIGKILDLPVEERLGGTAAVVAVSAQNGANIVRVHDVKEMKQVVRVVDSITRSELP